MYESLSKLATGTWVAMSGRFAGRLFALAGDVVAARWLGPALFGIYSIGWTIFRLLELLTPLGLDMGVIRFGSKYFGDNPAALNRILLDSLTKSTLFGCVLAVVMYFGAPWLASQVFHKPELGSVLKLFALGLPFTGLLTVLAAASRLTHDMRYTIIMQDLGQPLLAFILLLGFIVLKAGIVGVVISDLLSYGVLVVLGLFFLTRIFPGLLNPASVRGTASVDDLLAFSIAASLTTVLNTLVFWVDRLLVGSLLPAGDAGVYQAVSQLSVVFAMVLGSLSRIVVPVFARLHHQERLSELEEIFRVSTKWGIYVSVPALILLVFWPADVLSATYGAAYAIGAPVLFVLIIGQVANLLTGPVAPLLVATGHQNFTLGLSGAGLAINIGLNVALVPRYGLLGAALATTIALFLFYAISLIAARRWLRVWPYDRRYFKGMLAAASAVLAASLASMIHVPYAPLALIFRFLAAAAGFFAMLLLMRPDPEDLELMARLRGLVRGARAGANESKL